MKKAWIAMVVVGLAAAVVMWFCGRSADWRSAAGDDVMVSASSVPAGVRPDTMQPVRAAGTLISGNGGGSNFDDGDDDALPPKAQALNRRIEMALAEDSLADAVKCAAEAQHCKQVEVRRAMVDALGWFGKAALPELTPFLADADDEVRESAQVEWLVALADIDDEPLKIAILERAMNIIIDDDYLDDISTEYIGADEKLVVESLMWIIKADGSQKGVAKSKEIYEMVTGDEWQGMDEAARWIREEYQPPEDD